MTGCGYAEKRAAPRANIVPALPDPDMAVTIFTHHGNKRASFEFRHRQRKRTNGTVSIALTALPNAIAPDCQRVAQANKAFFGTSSSNGILRVVGLEIVEGSRQPRDKRTSSVERGHSAASVIGSARSP